MRSEERYPAQGPHSVIVVVVDRDAPAWREKLVGPFEDYFGRDVSDPLAPVQLEVIDRAADEAIRRLIDAGLVAASTRAVRELHGPSDDPAASLSEEEKSRAGEHRRQAARRLRMAALLGGGGMLDEERDALLQCLLSTGRALAVEHRIGEPADIGESLRAPHAVFWTEHLQTLRDFVADPAASCAPVAAALRAIIG